MRFIAAIITLLMIQISFSALASSPNPVKSVAGYCSVLDGQIASLANRHMASTDELARVPPNEAASNPAKVTERQAALVAIEKSLATKELEWYHLGCSQLLLR